MKIKIAHLYYDLMNLYGENANIRALKKAFERQNIETEIHFLTIGDEIDFNDYDIFYIGSGTEKYQLLVLEDLMKKKYQLKEAIENNKYIFATGNSIELFGEFIEDLDGNRFKCLNIFDYYTKVIDMEHYTKDVKFRITGEIVFKSSLIEEVIIGFQNRSGTLYNVNSPLFSVIEGCGNFPKDINEGYTYKNFYATYTIGPIFMRNPHFTNYFVKKILTEKDTTFIYNKVENTAEEIAYNEYLKNFVNEKKDQK